MLLGGMYRELQMNSSRKGYKFTVLLQMSFFLLHYKFLLLLPSFYSSVSSSCLLSFTPVSVNVWVAFNYCDWAVR